MSFDWDEYASLGSFDGLISRGALLEVIQYGRALEAERDALRADAERYRYLRSLPAGSNHADMMIMITKRRPVPNNWCVDPVRGEQMDSAIDAAIAAKEPK